MSQRYRPYQQPPGEFTPEWATWVTAALNATVAPITPPPAPAVTATAKPGAVYLTWNEVPGAASYNIYVNGSATLPGAPTATVPAVPGNASNAYLAVVNTPSPYYFAVAAVTANGSLGTLSGWVKASALAGAGTLTTLPGAGKDIIPNPGFESAAEEVAAASNVVGATVADDWTISADTNGVFTIGRDSSSSHSGNYSLLIRLAQNVLLPPSTTVNGGVVSGIGYVPVTAGTDILRFSGFYTLTQSVALPAGVTLNATLTLNVYSSTGVLLTALQVATSTFTASWTQIQGALLIPATVNGVAPAYVLPTVLIGITNSNGSAVTTGSNLYADFRVDDLKLVFQQTAFDLTPLNTSGQPTTTASPLSNTGAATVISVASTTWQFGDGQVTYNSGSVDPGAYGTYYIYANDPTYSGGAVTYVASANPWSILAANGYIYFGKITTTSGTAKAGAGGGTGGGGGGGKGSLT